ncbi:dihydropteroate synthase [Marinobacterium zhoushanense]|uniref:Dihydropteroate synthase n=1 Tax=Marinobacterium zhoushanense TaxID=1679163 RepID=A0ABQ1KKV5_9GAMM|nr:dihydropteroate synthase [Marinobacterium zhoushanense]GGB99938.1 dihydropteroate synthase [Marinobacterium zhoushanense]
MTQLKCASRTLDLGRVQVMGILNVTPDSFSDGGHLYRASKLSVEQALVHAAAMLSEGASMIDVGGESTRPGAAPVSVQEELDRVIPVIERINAELDVVISVDTSAPEVIREAAAAGAGLINDVRALAREGALEAVAQTDLPVCLMHMQGASPATMQLAPSYQDILAEVKDFLQQQVERCAVAGIARERLVLDPGFGFGKTLEHNLTLLRRMDELNALGLPLLVGTSRKSMIGQALGREVDNRLAGSLATAALAVERGGRIIRVHDVAATVDVVRMTEAVLNGCEQE